MYGRFHHCIITILAVAVVIALGATEASAQSPNWAFDSKTLNVGELSNFYTAGGAKPHVGGIWGLDYPAWHRYTSNQVGQGLFIGAKNFTDENGDVWLHKVAQIGFRAIGRGEVFPVLHEATSRIEPPRVLVDGAVSFKYVNFFENEDPSMEADASVTTVVNSLIGVTLTRKVYAFSQEEHDNYHIVEYVFTNTGEIEPGRTVPQQTLRDVYIGLQRSYAINDQATVLGSGGGWGKNVMNDVVGDDLKNYETDFRAQYAWLGHDTDYTRWNMLGGPILEDAFTNVFEGDSLGRLSAAHFVGYVTLHADRSATDSSDDPSQPSATGFISNGSEIGRGHHEDKELMALKYEAVEGGHTGSHADFVVGPPTSDPEPAHEWRERMAYQRRAVSTTISGEINFTSYGPYTLEPGEGIRIVQAEGVAGLSPKAALEIGRAFKAHHRAGNPDAPIGFDANGDGQISPETELMSKNMWVMTARDSLFQMFERAQANFESGFDIPRPPMPPREFRVTSGPDRISLEWDTYADANQTGFELYRAAEKVEGEYSGYELIAGIDELGPTISSYEDSNVQRGISYYYYLLAVGEVNDDPSGLTPTGRRLKSNRAYTQTYDPAFLREVPGESMADIQIVPNPYNMASDTNVRWPDQRDRIGFLDIPGICTIKIYTQVGELIETIEHTDGSGDEFWNLTTSSNQLIVSGIYLAVIQNHETKEQAIKKFVVIR